MSGRRARSAIAGIALVSGLAMTYVGAFQVRAVPRLVCPVFGEGCEAVADAPFARPFGIPDGFLGGGLYGMILVVALAARRWPRLDVLVLLLAGAAMVANVEGILDMARLGAFCFWCTATAVLNAPLLALAAWLAWRLKRGVTSGT